MVRFVSHIVNRAKGRTGEYLLSSVTRARFFGKQLWLAIALLMLFSHEAAASGPRPLIVNNAQLLSNSSVVTASTSTAMVVVRTVAVIEFMKYAPNTPGAEQITVSPTRFRDSTGAIVAMPNPVEPAPPGTAIAINLNNPVPLVPATVFHGFYDAGATGEPVFVKLTDDDQNLDPNKIETVEVTLQINDNGEEETLILAETGPDTGVFVGYIQTIGGTSSSGSATDNDGKLSIFDNAKISALYTDNLDTVKTYEASSLIDPYGAVFDSSNGKPVDGAAVTLMNATTGQPAVIYGDDGVSRYPATVTSGGTVRDDSGRIYSFPPGGYRFPFIQPGQYLIMVTPPAGYAAPSTLPLDKIKAVKRDGTSDTFAIDDNGSLGKPFTINPGPALHIDVPVDPVSSSLWVTKTASKSTAAIGDFLQYKITVENTGQSSINQVQANDRLPLGFRYRNGSSKLYGAGAPDPAISPDGRTLTFDVGTLDPGKTADLSFVVELGAGARPGKTTNLATATGQGGTVSNTARADVEVTDDFFTSSTFIAGRVFPNGCSQHQDAPGVSGVRIYLEDGTYAVTDKNGMYHFTAITPGTHVVQIDPMTVPSGYEVVACEENTRFAGNPSSQFVDLQGGSLWRADFHLALKKKTPVDVNLELRSSLITTQTCSTHDGSVSGIDRDINGKIGAGDAPCFGELKIKDSRLSASTGRNGDASEPKDVAVMVPFADEQCCVPDADGKYTIAYQADFQIGQTPVRNLRLFVSMPEGAAYKTGSSSLGDVALPDPDRNSGLVYSLGDRPAGWKSTLRFRATAPAQGAEGNLPAKAFLVFDTADTKEIKTSPADTYVVRYRLKRENDQPDAVFYPTFATLKADLSEQDRKEIVKFVQQLKSRKIEHITITGHTDADAIKPGASRQFGDNYALSRARAATVARVVIKALGLSSDRVTIVGKGPDEPVATNKTAKGRQRNRRVEFKIDTREAAAWTYLRNGKQSSGPTGIAKNPLPGDTVSGEKKGQAMILASAASMPVVGQLSQSLATQSTASALATAATTSVPQEKQKDGLLSPVDGAAFATRINAVRVVLNSQLKPQLLIDGKEVPADRIGFSMSDSKTGKTVYSYIGVDFGDAGIHNVEFRGNDPFGNARFEQKISVTRTGEIASLRVKSAEGNVADGKTPVRLQLEALDAKGNIINAECDLEVRDGTLKPPAKDITAQDIVKTDNTVRVHVDAAGNALFQPVGTSGLYRVTLGYNNSTLTAETYVKPEMRDWILVGLGEGTVGYNTVKGNMESFTGSAEDANLYDNGRVAFFAKGQIQGKWLLTMAYDSARHDTRDQTGLYRTIDPNKYYTLYGDGTIQGSEAASARSLYLKIERDQFYALFGDYDTGLTVTELSRYSRQFNGFKSEMKGDTFGYTVFASDTNQAFVKDEIPGDGTSGLYHLSRGNIVLNSETVVIETRDRFRSEVIVNSQPLSRFLDYTIDYDNGTIWFKAPVFNRDENFNPIFIVVRYETFDAATRTYNYGGRGSVKVLNNRVELGATHVHEGEVGGEGDLNGVDTTVNLDSRTKIRAEVATTKTDQAGVQTDGSAYLAEVSHQAENMEGKAYVREQGNGFGLGQQNGSETGTRKIGYDFLYRWNQTTSVKNEIFRQENLMTGAVRDMASVEGKFSQKKYDLFSGFTHAEDSFLDGQTNTSDQIFAGARYQLTDRFTMNARRDQSLGSNNTNVDFPTRTTIGAEYKLTQTTAIVANEEWTQGAQQDTTTTILGMRTAPWSGGQVNSTVEQQATENGDRLFSTLGLKQTWQVNRQWSVDAGLDRTDTIRQTQTGVSQAQPATEQFNVNVPPASGGTDFTAVSLGAGYREEKWSWTGRIEKRWGADEDKLGLMTGTSGEMREGLGLAAGVTAFQSLEASGTRSATGDARFGLAYRPLETHWIVLDRLDFLLDKRRDCATVYDNWRTVNNLVMNLKTDSPVQLSFQYGAKYVLETIEQNDYRGYTDLMGIESRYDINKKWDVGIRGLMLHSWQLDQKWYGTGVSTGFNAGKNIWVSVGYNFTGFRDRDFSKADFTSEGPFIKMRLKFDQVSVREAVRWIAGQ